MYRCATYGTLQSMRRPMISRVHCFRETCVQMQIKSPCSRYIVYTTYGTELNRQILSTHVYQIYNQHIQFMSLSQPISNASVPLYTWWHVAPAAYVQTTEHRHVRTYRTSMFAWLGLGGQALPPSSKHAPMCPLPKGGPTAKHIS